MLDKEELAALRRPARRRRALRVGAVAAAVLVAVGIFLSSQPSKRQEIAKTMAVGGEPLKLKLDYRIRR